MMLFFLLPAEDCGCGVQDFSPSHGNSPTPPQIWSDVLSPAFHLCFWTLTLPVFHPASSAVDPPPLAALLQAFPVCSCQNFHDPPLRQGQELMQVPTRLALVPVSRVHFVHHPLFHHCDAHLSFFTVFSKISDRQPS